MPDFLKSIAFCAVLAAPTPALAVIFDPFLGESNDPVRDFLISDTKWNRSIDILPLGVPPVPSNISMKGFFRLGRQVAPVAGQPEGDLTKDAIVNLSPQDILDYALDFDLPLFSDGTSATVTATPSNSSLSFLPDVLQTDGLRLDIDLSSLSPNEVGLTVAVDDFGPNGFGFPDGRRFGGNDELLLLQIFSGSVNMGAVIFGNGQFAPPTHGGFAQIDPLSRTELARFTPAAAPVPLPPAALALGAALLGLGALRRLGRG